MRQSQITATFLADIATVWSIVTNNKATQWRSDLAKAQVFDGGARFIEHRKDGFETTFRITEKEPLQKYAFTMEGKHFTGYWQGLFSETPTGGTQIAFTETMQLKNPLMELLSYAFLHLRNMQEQYITDLRIALGEAQE